MSILVAIDGSTASEIVLQEPLERPWATGTRFCLLTVVDPFFFTPAPLLFEETKVAAGELLEEAAEKFRAAGWETETRVALGNPRKAISRCAEEWRSDLLPVGSHRSNALERLALGEHGARGAASHGMLGGGGEDAGETNHGRCSQEENSCGNDGSEFVKAAVNRVAREAWSKDTEIKIISVPEFALCLGEYPSSPRARAEELHQSALDAANAAVTLAKEILSRTSLTVRTEVPLDPDAPATTILGRAKQWNEDLIVLGSHGRRGFDRWANGSVSESSAMNAHCSVQVVPIRVSTEINEYERESHESERSHDGHAIHVP